MKRITVLLTAVVLFGLNVSFAAAQQPSRFDLSGCWSLTASSYYNPNDTVTVSFYNYMQQLLVDPTPNQQGTPNQMIPKGPLFQADVIKFSLLTASPGDVYSGDVYIGNYVSGIGISDEKKASDHWVAHVVTGGTQQTPVYYVPMILTGPTERNFSTMGDAYIAAHAGVADSNTRITGTWVDSRGAMNLRDLQCADQSTCPNTADAHKVSLHTNIFTVGTGRFTLDRMPVCPR